MVQIPTKLIREFLPVVLVLGAIVWGLVHNRRRLRPWYLLVAALAAAVSVPLTLYLVTEARAGNLSGWGGLGALLILLPAVFVAAISVSALVTLAILVPRYGFNPPTAAEREAARKHRRSPEGRREFALFRLKLSAIGLGIVLSVIALRELLR